MKTRAILFILYLMSQNIFSQKYTEILGRPTDHSITINVLFDNVVDLYFEYGTEQGNYSQTTSVVTSTSGIPVETQFTPLLPETRYYYRTRYRISGTADYLASAEHTFITQRKRGSKFSFTIEADPHPYDKKGCHNLWYRCLNNQLNDGADFMIDMGDTFGDDHNPFTITNSEVQQLQLNCRSFFGSVCHSMPLFFCIGNHEGESGYYLLQTPPNNLATYETLWRKLYYPNPVPDDFYSGNTSVEDNGMGQPENYFAWEWGDALFIVMDGWRYYTVSAKPRNWDWTIGKEQYDWFKKTLESSNAKYKFVFTHHVMGETRGGVGVANLCEWGGYDQKGNYTFSTNRPGWSDPIHQLMIKNNVTLFFQGHDHLYAKEELDGLIYQTVPMPSDSTYKIGVTDNGDAFTGTILDGSGHLRVTVDNDNVTVDYVSAILPANETESLKNDQVVYSYSVAAKGSAIQTVNSDDFDWEIYPNPVQENFRLRVLSETNETVKLKIVSSDGKEIYTQTLDTGATKSFDIHPNNGNNGKLATGVYALVLERTKNNPTQKLLIVK